jgi:hypothetical protein
VVLQQNLLECGELVPVELILWPEAQPPDVDALSMRAKDHFRPDNVKVARYYSRRPTRG